MAGKKPPNTPRAGKGVDVGRRSGIRGKVDATETQVSRGGKNDIAPAIGRYVGMKPEDVDLKLVAGMLQHAGHKFGEGNMTQESVLKSIQSVSPDQWKTWLKTNGRGQSIGDNATPAAPKEVVAEPTTPPAETASQSRRSEAQSNASSGDADANRQRLRDLGMDEKGIARIKPEDLSSQVAELERVTNEAKANQSQVAATADSKAAKREAKLQRGRESRQNAVSTKKEGLITNVNGDTPSGGAKDLAKPATKQTKPAKEGDTATKDVSKLTYAELMELAAKARANEAAAAQSVDVSSSVDVAKGPMKMPKGFENVTPFQAAAPVVGVPPVAEGGGGVPPKPPKVDPVVDEGFFRPPYNPFGTKTVDTTDGPKTVDRLGRTAWRNLPSIGVYGGIPLAIGTGIAVMRGSGTPQVSEEEMQSIIRDAVQGQMALDSRIAPENRNQSYSFPPPPVGTDTTGTSADTIRRFQQQTRGNQ